ncbi:MAG TPA: hypothetical protein VFK13_09315 [Gemmatimonadaceae bacterium]|nr:hypothetical protein [Gemmatimonadaceae bacterium]
MSGAGLVAHGSAGSAGREAVGTGAGALDESALVAAIRAEQRGAIEELIRRYQHLVMSQGRRFGIAPAERRAWAVEVLYEVGVALGRRGSPAPRALVPYILEACRRRAITRKRRLATRERAERDGAYTLEHTGERAAIGVCSEHAVRSTYGPAWEPPTLPDTIERLAAALGRMLRPEERQLFSWVGQHVPYATIGAWLGISRGAAIKRVARLRARLLDAAVAYAATLADDELRAVVAFFTRTRAFDASALAARLRTARARHHEGERHDDSS